MFFEQAADGGNVVRFIDRCHVDECFVDVEIKPVIFVKDIGRPAGHAGSKVAASRTEDQHAAAGHVFTAVFTDAFDDGGGAGISHAEAFTGNAVDESFSGGGAVEGDITDDDVVFRNDDAVVWRIDDKCTTGKTFQIPWALADTMPA